MKRKIGYALVCFFLMVLSAGAQVQIKFGKVSYSQMLQAMPEYLAAKQQMTSLRAKYEKEATYNETSFKRMFAEFLQLHHPS